MSTPSPAAKPPAPRVSRAALLIAGLIVSLLVAGVASYYASSHPDGLEYVAGTEGFLDTAEDHKTSADSPMADYQTAGIGNERLSVGVAGITGTLLVLGIAGGIALMVRRRGVGDPAATADNASRSAAAVRDA